MKTDPSALLEEAHTIVDDLLQRLRTMIAEAQQRSEQLTIELRQAQRTLDEVVMQHQFANQRQFASASALAAREKEARAVHQALSQESATLQRSLKQLDQLMRQIDMSSSSLLDASTHGASDPWALALRSQVILGREEERVRLAREVHDGPAQVMANTLMGLEQGRTMMQDQQLDTLGQLLDRLSNATREGLREMRQFIADLRPGRLEEHGLVFALQEYLRRYQEIYPTRVSFETDTIPRLSNEVEIVLYRIVQESLQNAHKHARGAPVHVTLSLRPDQLSLSIRDEGPGFDAREVARRAGRESWGLTSMRERAEMIGAKYVVSSRPGAGTEVSVRLPLSEMPFAKHSFGASF
ncbi:MAG: sensor histidine kinase [Chloroflexaceae bacterium]|nr:sensor histidine kinase [Chloroflexaceae bacterium]